MQLSIVGSVVFAMLLGGLIGYEREARNRPAGLRTHMMVAGAAALLLGIADLMAEHFSDESYQDLLRIDPIRIIEALVTAVAFIGAGTIIQHAREDAVLGLTTAASLLFTAAIGVGVGLQQYVMALGVTLVALMVLHVLTGPAGKEDH
ncbi:MAG: magnesium transporter [Gammaproteobacteria bacterium]|nr:magnesium transporter [Gammaproteobacteria bacterium]